MYGAYRSIVSLNNLTKHKSFIFGTFQYIECNKSLEKHFNEKIESIEFNFCENYLSLNSCIEAFDKRYVTSEKKLHFISQNRNLPSRDCSVLIFSPYHSQF